VPLGRPPVNEVLRSCSLVPVLPASTSARQQRNLNSRDLSGLPERKRQNRRHCGTAEVCSGGDTSIKITRSAMWRKIPRWRESRWPQTSPRKCWVHRAKVQGFLRRPEQATADDPCGRKQSRAAVAVRTWLRGVEASAAVARARFGYGCWIERKRWREHGGTCGGRRIWRVYRWRSGHSGTGGRGWLTGHRLWIGFLRSGAWKVQEVLSREMAHARPLCAATTSTSVGSNRGRVDRGLCVAEDECGRCSAVAQPEIPERSRSP